MYTLPTYAVRLHHVSDVVVPRIKIDDSDAAHAAFRQVLSDIPHEELWVLPIDGASTFRGLIRISQGGLHGCAIAMGDVFRPIIASGCNAFLMAHNHPSGDCEPSTEDAAMTDAVRQAGQVLGITLLDHLVLSRNGYASLATLMGF